jgi:cytochrome c oxidase subunit 1
MDERLGKLNFWATFIGFNVTFFPMHFLGLAGMPRRYYTYGENSGWNFWNLVVSFGAFFLGASILLFAYNIAKSVRGGERAGNNPWDAPTLEWSIPSPAPEYNFAVIPQVTHRDQLWADKYGDGHGPADAAHAHAPVAVAEEESHEEVHVHLPNPSFYPLILGIGLFVMGLGLLIDNPVITIGLLHLPSLMAAGVLVILLGIYGWAFEPAG